MIKRGNMDDIQKLIRRLGSEIKGIVESAFEISYFSRGAWSYHDVLMMCQAEREIAVDFINERLKLAAKSPHPVF
jgi:hypothetical protein